MLRASLRMPSKMLKMGLHLEWLHHQNFKSASRTFWGALWRILSAHGYRQYLATFSFFIGPRHFQFQTGTIGDIDMDSWWYIYVCMIHCIIPCFSVNVLVAVPYIPFCEYASWFPSCFHDSACLFLNVLHSIHPISALFYGFSGLFHWNLPVFFPVDSCASVFHLFLY